MKTDRTRCCRHWSDYARPAIVAALLGCWSMPVAAQMRPEPPGMMPSGAGGPSLSAAPSGAGLPGNSSQEMVVDVRIAGNKSVPLEKILPCIRTRAGRAYDSELIKEDIRRMDQTRMFVDVKTWRQPVKGGVAVVFDVLERPLLQEVKYIGCKKVRKKKLAKETNLKPGDPLDPFTVEEARRKIEEYYHKEGFAGARITIIEGDKPEDRRAIFVINEGAKQKIAGIKFIGNTIADSGRLKTQIQSKTSIPPFLYWFRGELDRKQLDEDVERLTAYYRGLGFFRARIGKELEYNEEKDRVDVTFVIDEGPRYTIREVSVNGNKQYSSDELMAELKLRGGEYFNQAKMTADIGALQDKYGSVGYVFADIKADPRFLEDPGKLDLVYNIKEGDAFRVGKINIKIKGEYPHTQLFTVRDRLSFHPGDIIDIREIRASERRLRASQLFESNPAMGQAPKIVFNPPGQKSPEEEEEQVAERPRDRISRGDKNRGMDRGPGRGGMGSGDNMPAFRGQSPDPAPRERVVDITLDCTQMDGGERRPEDKARIIELSAPVERPRDRVAPRYNENDRLWQASKELNDALSNRPRPRLPRDRVISTQYTPDQGQVNPAARSWTSKTAAATPLRSVSSPNDAYSAPNDAYSTPPSTQAAPVQPAPAYGSQMWPRQGGTRPVETPEGQYAPGPLFDESSPVLGGKPDGGDSLRTLDFEVMANEAMTGRMMFGVGVNSDAGLVGQIVIDEQNFDWTRFPRSWEDIRNATAFRGAGQRFRIEAVPGTELQRYMVTFQDPYLFHTQISLGLSGYFYNRSYREWFEQRIGGRVALGYQFTPDLSGSIAYRGAKINVTDCMDPSLPEFSGLLGRDLALHGFSVALSRDKRDNAFMATEGHLIEATLEQVVGSFSYPRAELDMRKYFTLHERPDGSGRHVLSLAGRAGYSGDNTPIYERFFAGGFSSLRGFEFRGASPHVYSPYAGANVFVGGNFQLLASAEYMFPITADDMIRGVVFCDTGAVEPTISNWSDKYRVAPGFGLRISVPAMGPAPIALDFAFPVSWQPGDRFEVFSFFVGFGR